MKLHYVIEYQNASRKYRKHLYAQTYAGILKLATGILSRHKCWMIQLFNVNPPEDDPRDLYLM